MTATRPLAALAALAVIAPPAIAQSMSGADRYMGSVQSSLGRTNGTIASIAPNFVTPSTGGSPMIGATQQSFDRTTAAMRSILANRDAAIRGYGESAIYRTSDNLYGVYWQMYYARRAMERSVYLQSLPDVPSNRTMTSLQAAQLGWLNQMAQADRARRQAQMAARGEELARRFNRTDPTPPPSPGIFTPEMIQNEPTRPDPTLRDVTITAPVPIPTTVRRPSSRD